MRRLARSPRIHGLSVGLSAAGFVLLYWALEGFFLHQRGDALAFPRRCASLTGAPIEFLTSFQGLRVTFLALYCPIYAVWGMLGWIIVQIGLWALTCVLIYRAGSLLFGERAGLFAGMALVPLWETFRFALRPQDDIMLLFTLALVLYALAAARRRDTAPWHALSVVALIAFSFSRPFAMVIAVGFVGWTVKRRVDAGGFSITSPTILALGTLIGVLATFFVGTFLLRQLVFEHTTQGVSWRRSLTAVWANGIVVTHPGTPTFEYLYTPRAASSMLGWLFVNVDHLAIMGLFKMAFFFVPVLPRWSTFHIVVNTVTVFPLMIGAAGGTVLLLSRGQLERAALVVIPVAASLMTVAVFFLDGGFNYRAPATLSFALLSGYWASEIAENFDMTDRLRTLVTG